MSSWPLSFLPETSWPVVTVLVAIALAALTAAFATGRLRGRGRRGILLLHAVTGFLLVLAALNPVLHRPGQAAGSHLTVALDVSSSVQRAGRDWADVRSTVEAALDEVIAGLRPQVRRTSTASLVAFARGVHPVVRDVPLAELSRAVSRLAEEDLPPGDASDLETGLEAAAEALEDVGRGAVVLVSDGHETTGDARAAARTLGRRGFAVHVVALGGRVPEIGLYAADLPRQVEAERPTSARLLLTNSSSRELPLDLTFRRAGERGVSRPQTLPGTGWFHLRQPLVFEEPGLTYLDVELRAETAAPETPGTNGGGQRQSRRFFTYVASPPRILVVGDDHRWTRALSAERFRLEMVSPEHLAAVLEPSRFDAVVLHEVESERVTAPHALTLAKAVVQSGLGLFVFNGDQEALEERTVLMSYDGTPIAALLPVINRPRPVLETPPARDVVILIDTSGSMSGWPLRKSKQIAAAIIHRLRGIDRLHLIAFTGGAHPLVSDLNLTGRGKEKALAIVGSLTSGGGTDPTLALAMIGSQRFENCGLFMISDGEFAIVNARPDCEATAFAIGKSAGNVPAALAAIAEPFPVPDDSFDPAGIKIGYFDPKPRHNRFEPGGYTPIPGVDAFYGGWSLLPEPALPLDGNAVTHIREDAELAAARPRPRDPVLAFRDSRNGAYLGGTVGAFTTHLPASYYDSAQGASAVSAWMERLLAHSDRERYAFRLEDRGEAIELRLTLLSKGGAIPRVNRVSARLEIPGTETGTETVQVALRPDAELSGVFTGSIRMPRPSSAAPDAGVTHARLVVYESGPDAPRRPQRIPIVIPPARQDRRIVGNEAWSFGLDSDLLRAVAVLSGGRVLEPGEETVLLHGAGSVAPSRSFWPWLAGAAILFLLLQVALRRMLS